VRALAGQRVEVNGQGRHQGLALARLHLGDLALVQHHAADHLDIVMPQAEGPNGGLAHQRERLRQQAVQRFTVGVAFPQFGGFRLHLLVGQRLDRFLERIDPRDGLAHLFHQPLVAAADDFGNQLIEHLTGYLRDFRAALYLGSPKPLNKRRARVLFQRRLLTKAEGLIVAPSLSTSKWTWGADALPVLPILAIT
jgi:hypothetical protein